MIDKLSQTFKDLSNPNHPKFEIYKRNLLILPGGVLLIALVATYMFIGIPSEANANNLPNGTGGMNTTMPSASVEEVASTKDKAIEVTSRNLFQLPSDTGVNLANVKDPVPDTVKTIEDYNNTANQNVQNALTKLNAPNEYDNSQFSAEDNLMKKYQQQADNNITQISDTPPVTNKTEEQDQESIQQTVQKPKSIFHSITVGQPTANQSPTNSSYQKTETVSIPAAILKKVKAENGQTVAIRILKATTVEGIVIPKNKILRGIVSIGNSRVKITVPGANINGKLSDAKFSVFDNAGIEGLEVAGIEKLAAGDELKDEALSSNIPTDNFGILNGVTNVVRALGNKRSPKVFLPDGKIILKYIGN